jgi:2-polyprenyl-6-methoxyphenol hydroxylase-like FAD-dependent oxidoreductase
MIPKNTDVLIVGAGPTGLALAISLEQAGVDCLLIDKLPEPLNTSRAGVIHAHTLDMLDRLGVTSELVAKGVKVTNFAIRDRGRQLVRLPFDSLPSRHPYLLMLPQDQTEKVLTDRLAALGGSVVRSAAATYAEQDSPSARVSVAVGDNETAVKARYVVAADGMHSVIRTDAGIEFEGAPYPESFILADVRMDWPFGATEVSLFFSPEGLVVVAPLPGGVYRIVATRNAAPAQPSIEDVQALLDARGPVADPIRVRELLWSTRFRIHHRLARSYRQGRFFLMGDAAHVHSPAGGQGMNTGLVDAVVLGELLGGVIRGTRPESDLDCYEQLRRPAAAQVLTLAGALTTFATVRGTVKRAARNCVLSLVNVLPPARKRLMMNLSGLSRAEFTAVPPERSGVRAIPRASRGKCAAV